MVKQRKKVQAVTVVTFLESLPGARAVGHLMREFGEDNVVCDPQQGCNKLVLRGTPNFDRIRDTISGIKIRCVATDVADRTLPFAVQFNN